MVQSTVVARGEGAEAPLVLKEGAQWESNLEALWRAMDVAAARVREMTKALLMMSMIITNNPQGAVDHLKVYLN